MDTPGSARIPGAKPLAAVRAEFDHIASLSADRPDQLGPHEPWLLQQAPAHMGDVLDVGCGTGAFTRELARRADHVVGIDLSPRMIEVARRRSREFSNIDYFVADAMTSDLSAGRFDCVASLAMMHHVSLKPALLRLRDAVAPDGVLLILDLDDSSGLANLPRNALAWVEKAVHRRAWATPKELATAWAEHGRGEEYPRFSDVRALCAELLPGARVTRHLSWRYSIVWRRP